MPAAAAKLEENQAYRPNAAPCGCHAGGQAIKTVAPSSRQRATARSLKTK